MRILEFQLPNSRQAEVGIVTGNEVVQVSNLVPHADSVESLIAHADLTTLSEVVERGQRHQLSDVRIMCPLPRAQKILCVGLNYRDHAIESGMEIPNEPVVFNKLSGTLCGHQDDVPLPSQSSEVDFEAELVLVIGKNAFQVSEEEAEGCIFGVTCGHDVSARDWQLRKPGGQWLLGKSFPGFAPIGPWIVPVSEFSDLCDLQITMRLNGETVQDSSTRQLIFSPAKLVSYISHCCQLVPGDVIFTGTPPGVGMAQDPPRYLQSGDLCEVEIEGIGVLSNRFV